MKTRDIIIDADHILFMVCESKTYKTGFDVEEDDYDDSWGEEAEVDLEPYINHFKSIVEDYVLTAEVESICFNWTVGKTRVIMSDSTNFRYGIYPEYKKDRPSSPELRKLLKEWAVKEYTVEPNTEADDVVAYYVRKGGVGFTTDKDLFAGVEGIWFNSHFKHKCWVYTNKKDAEHFFKCQVLAGDRVDGIPSIAGVGIATAEKLMKKYGSSWDDILSIFNDPAKVLGKKPRDQSYDKDYMITMTRLVCMSQWTPKKGVVLWKFPK